MITLAVDTSSLTASCAVVEDGRVISELSMQYGKTHSQKIVPMLRDVLAMLKKSFQDIDLFAAAIGPGSFTGLRIGVVTIKALAYSLKKPVCGISTLDALAYSLPDFKGVLVPMLDARNNQVFSAIFHKKDNHLDKISPDRGISIEELIAQIKDQDEDAMVIGDAVPLHLEKMRAVLGGKIIEAPPALSFPRAASTALLAEQVFRDNKAINAFELEPQYLRKSQAERMKSLSNGPDAN